MKIPDFLDSPLVDKNGMLTPEWATTFAVLFTEMQNNLSDEGINLPRQPTVNIDQLTGDQSIGAVIYDNDLDVAKVNLAGTWVTIDTTP